MPEEDAAEANVHVLAAGHFPALLAGGWELLLEAQFNTTARPSVHTYPISSHGP
jgi:hypothetical protein